jgi:signal transduction histidine kinase
MLGSSCRWLFHPEREYHTSDNCIVAAALNGDSRNLAFTTSENGRARYFDASATPIEDSHGKHRALVFLREVTDRRLQELQLMQSEKMACMGLLAAGVAHEINNPLTSVAGYAEALIRRFNEDPDLAGDQRLEVFQRYLNVIIRESYRCKGIINGLLTFSRKSDGSVDTVDINMIVREVLDLVRPKATAEKVAIEERFATDLPIVKGDAAGLRQVFMNLVMNALQAIEGAGQIILTSSAEDGMVLVKVKDSGCGIPRVLLDQIWDPFFTTKTVGQGVGLGLAVTYNIVHRHGGEIIVETRENEGACFTVRLPA